MSDDPQTLAAELDTLARRIRRLPQGGDVIDLIAAGELLTTEQAADISERDQETIRRWCEDGSLGVKQAKFWLIGTRRLLDYIEQHQGKHARLVAETRAKKYLQMWGAPQQSLSSLAKAAQ